MEDIGHVVNGCMKVRVKTPEAIQPFGVPQLFNYLEGWNLADGVGETNESLNQGLQSSVYQQENLVEGSCDGGSGAIKSDPEYLTTWRHLSSAAQLQLEDSFTWYFFTRWSLYLSMSLPEQVGRAAQGLLSCFSLCGLVCLGAPVSSCLYTCRSQRHYFFQRYECVLVCVSLVIAYQLVQGVVLPPVYICQAFPIRELVLIWTKILSDAYL